MTTNVGSRARTALCIAVLAGAAIAQTIPDVSTGLVRISGRVVDPGRGPASYLPVNVARIEVDGAKLVKSVRADAQGAFTFVVRSAAKYQIEILTGPAFKNQLRLVDTNEGKDIELGDMVLQPCPVVNTSAPKAPTSQPALVGDLRLAQILIESKQASISDLGIPQLDSKWSSAVAPSSCWSGYVSLARRTDWEGRCDVSFDSYASLERFVGGKVKAIHVVRFPPKLPPAQVREQVRKVWLGSFHRAECSITWSEGNPWKFVASVEYENGKRTFVLMDGWMHVRVQDRNGKYWYLR